ncbi:DNA cytosine methyltransferase, partial [Paraburkholderia sp. SIMBA_054]
TIRRWKTDHSCPRIAEAALREMLHTSARNTHSESRADFQFIDLFAGIGGIRRGFEAHGGQCVFTSEWNEFSKKTYQQNHQDASHAHQFV